MEKSNIKENSISAAMHEREESRLTDGKAMAPESQEMITHMQAKGDKSGIGEDGAQTSTLGDVDDTLPTSHNNSSESTEEPTGDWNEA